MAWHAWQWHEISSVPTLVPTLVLLSKYLVGVARRFIEQEEAALARFVLASDHHAGGRVHLALEINVVAVRKVVHKLYRGGLDDGGVAHEDSLEEGAWVLPVRTARWVEP